MDKDPLLDTMRPETVKSFRNLLDTFSGADGGGRFHSFRLLIEEMERRVKGGDKTADQVLQPLHQVSRLINLANGQ